MGGGCKEGVEVCFVLILIPQVEVAHGYNERKEEGRGAEPLTKALRGPCRQWLRLHLLLLLLLNLFRPSCPCYESFFATCARHSPCRLLLRAIYFIHICPHIHSYRIILQDVTKALFSISFTDCETLKKKLKVKFFQ